MLLMELYTYIYFFFNYVYIKSGNLNKIKNIHKKYIYFQINSHIKTTIILIPELSIVNNKNTCIPLGTHPNHQIKCNATK